MDSINVAVDLVQYMEDIFQSKQIPVGSTPQDDGSVTFHFSGNNPPNEADVLAWVEEAKQRYQDDTGK